MIAFVNEPVSVEIQVLRDGTARPLAFAWRGRHFRVEAWGRESTETRDSCTLHCYLVQTGGMESWELCQDIETAQWTLMRHWARGPRIV